MENKKTEKILKPKIYLILKIIGFTMIPVGIALIITGAITLANSSSLEGVAFIMPGAFVTFISIPLLMFGFSPDIAKVATRTNRYIQQENKEDLESIATMKADISSSGVTKVAKAVKTGLKDTKYCKRCGIEIDGDSRFCKKCGKEQ